MSPLLLATAARLDGAAISVAGAAAPRLAALRARRLGL
jgi:hypothetical protein